ncbi:MAG: cysteine desulfurase family protein [Chloroflexi bacterium]|nr:cysteine desulfurase family protein [Chloroflexota bacterium]MCY3938758.1 cysteine desulfurase family protein [Chloroflexota bacterium]
MNESSRVYLDHASTTPVSVTVLEVMLPYFADYGYNPSGLYEESQTSRRALEEARGKVAAVFSCSTDEIVFTGSGSEGANLAIKGAAMAQRQFGRNVIAVSAIEHHCVLHAAEYLQAQHGFQMRVIPVDRYGIIDMDFLESMVDDSLAVVSVQYANNEVGTVQPIAEIGQMLEDTGALFHSDAVQAAGALSLDVYGLGVDLLSIAAHKFYGPKGVGALYVREGSRIVPQTQGGSQERNRRAGTENVALIMGLATALTEAQANREAENRRNGELSTRIRAGLAAIDGVYLNGHPEKRLPNNTNVCVEGINAESLILQLDRAGIAASSGSACTSASLEPSHVLLAMGVPPDLARGSLRISVGRANDESQIDFFLAALAPIVSKLRRKTAVFG